MKKPGISYSLLSCKSIKKPVSILLILLLTLLLTPLAAFILLRTAPVQTFLAHRAATYLSKQLNTEVTIGGFRLNWFLEAVITDIRILDKHNHVLLEAKKIRADVKSIDFKNHNLTLNAIALSEADVNLIQYKNDSSLNLQFIIDYFTSPVVDTTYSEPWLLRIDNAKLTRSHFAFRDERYMSPGRGIDFSDMDFSKLNLEVRNISIQGDSIIADIKQLTLKEKSGFFLDDFTTRATVCPRGLTAENLQVMTDKSRLSMDLRFDYNNWDAFNYFLDSIRITASIKPSQLDMRDIVSFAPDIYGMADVFDISGKIKGSVSSFTAKNFQLAFGRHTSFKGNITMNGLPDIEETFINLKTDQLYTNVTDIQSFTIPYSNGVNTIVLPDAITTLGNVSVNGRFTGFYNDFVSKATFITDIGQITTDILLTNNKATHNHEYNGEILVKTFDAGKILNVKQLGTVNIFASIKGKNFSLEKADLTMKGEITDMQYEGNTIGLINVDGEFRKKRFTGGVYVNDELLGLNFLGSADFSEALPAFNFKADILHANLAKLNLMTNDSVVLFSTSTDFKFQGNTIDNLVGALNFTNTKFTMGTKTLIMKDLSLSTIALSNGGKRMQVNSDFANAVFSGQYTFDDLADYLTMVFTEFLPSLSQEQKLPVRLNRGSFDYTVQLHHTDSLTAMFLPWLKINSQTVISGTFDPSLGLVNVNGRSPLIVLNGIALRNWTLAGSTRDKSLGVRMDCSQIDMSATTDNDSTIKKIEQFKLLAVAYDDSVKFGISWDDRKSPDQNKGDITGAVSFKQNPRLIVRIDNADLMINDTVWKSVPDNLLTFDNSFIEAQNIGLTNNYRHIIFNGTVSEDPLSQMVLDIKNFNISFADIIWQQAGIDLDGYVNGKVNLSELYSVPRLSADITIKDFGFNHESLGDAAIKSSWDNKNKSLGIDMKVIYVGNAGTHYPLNIVGNIYPERKHENFDLKADVDNLKVKTIEPFLKGIFSRMRGYTSGALTLTGDFSDPVIKGSVKLMRTELLVDYLRTSYSFTGDFNFDKDKMWFKDIELRDSTFGKGVVTGTIYHKAFTDFALDINLKADNLAALNTTYSPNEVYYGRAKASGTMTLKGSVDNLVLKADMQSEKGTNVVIPISFSRSISENSFIQYRKHGDADDSGLTPYEPSVLSLQLGLDVKKNADLSIILPYNMGTIDVQGDGLINMGIDTRGDYSMYGNYIMDNGTFLFNFENILKKNFQIQKGGSITFNGSPYDADIKLKAVYKVKTSLSGLPELSTEDQSKRINVNCIISLANDLYNPDIKFSIELPDATEEMKRSIFSIIDTTNALEMNQQMISLLVLNTFSSSSGITSAGASQGLGISSYEILSSQLSSLLSKISKDFDIGVNYRPGDQISPQELELALSTQLFDNRVTIDGAFGMNTYNNATANQTQQVIGDVLVEVKITEDGRFRFKAFNRTNTGSDVLFSTYSPYTQGVGIVFRKEFNGLKDLFKRSKKVKMPAKNAAKK